MKRLLAFPCAAHCDDVLAEPSLFLRPVGPSGCAMGCGGASRRSGSASHSPPPSPPLPSDATRFSTRATSARISLAFHGRLSLHVWRQPRLVPSEAATQTRGQSCCKGRAAERDDGHRSVPSLPSPLRTASPPRADSGPRSQPPPPGYCRHHVGGGAHAVRRQGRRLQSCANGWTVIWTATLQYVRAVDAPPSPARGRGNTESLIARRRC